jgi:DNA-directed RNA polymerase subunit RPC12/RpoP
MAIQTKGRLFFDIETSPNIGFFWQSGYKLQVPYTNIIKERAIICICYKWENDTKVYSLNWDKDQCDKQMLIDFIKIANEADELVGHNGDKFDLTWIRTRALFHRLPMFPQYTTIDTLKQARSTFRFNSNKLDYIANFLGIGSKLETGFGLWRDIVLNNDKKALASMIKYCKNDVVILEKVFNHLSSYVPHKTHRGVALYDDRNSCPHCGSKHINMNKHRTTASGISKVQYVCVPCGKYHTVSKQQSNRILIERYNDESIGSIS